MLRRSPIHAWLSLVTAGLLVVTSGHVALAGPGKPTVQRTKTKKSPSTSARPATPPKPQAGSALVRKNSATATSSTSGASAGKPPVVKSTQRQQLTNRAGAHVNHQRRIAQRGAGRALRAQRSSTHPRAQMRAEQQMRQELGLMARVKARTIRVRTFMVSIVAGLGGGILGRAFEFMTTSRPGFLEPGSLASSPTFGNPMAEMFTATFVTGAALAVGVTLLAGSLIAAHVSRKGRNIENGTTDLANVNPSDFSVGRQYNPFVPDQTVDNMPGAGTNLHDNLFE